MPAHGDSAGLDALCALVGALRPDGRRLTVLTGAGVSTECGVPDFRSADSPWRVHPPIGFKAWLSDPALRAEAWRRKFAIDDVSRGALPGRSHKALARLGARGLIRAVVTQNVDGLHQAAGLDPALLIELHGNGTFARCLACGVRVELSQVRRHLTLTGEAPVCGCGGLVKSATVAFGQPLDAQVLEAALQAACRCDLFIAVGSSLVVRPAAHLPILAKQRGAQVAVINREPTPMDDVANLVIRAEAADALTALEGVH